MKVIKEKSREYKGQAYYKYRINIPWKAMSVAGFKEGYDLEAEPSKGQIILKIKKKDEENI